MKELLSTASALLLAYYAHMYVAVYMYYTLHALHVCTGSSEVVLFKYDSITGVDNNDWTQCMEENESDLNIDPDMHMHMHSKAPTMHSM